MSIPDYESIMLPLLNLISDQRECSKSELVEKLADVFKLSEEERNILLPSGIQKLFYNRVGWALLYLKKAILIESKRKGFYEITKRGLEVLQENPREINYKFLERFKEFLEFKKSSKKSKEKRKKHIGSYISKTPQELVEDGYQTLREELGQELLENIKGCSPEFLEKLVVKLLLSMGYGGSRIDAGKVIGKSGDGGIDGIIKEDPLGLDNVYIQAKRWEKVVGSPEIKQFAGALLGMSVKKGIFITTSTYSKDAYNYVKNIDSRIILIDGELLTQLMIDHNVGVLTDVTYEIKKIDSDFFEED